MMAMTIFRLPTRERRTSVRSSRNFKPTGPQPVVVYWPEFDREQLFDLDNDPREERDLAGLPERAMQLAKMKARFKELRAEVR